MNRSLALVLLLLLPSVLAAQPDPNVPGQPPPPPNRQVNVIPPILNLFARATAVEITPNGLFVLAEGVLARYSPDLEQRATLQLLPPLPPAEGKDGRQAQQKWLNERALRSAPAAMLPAGDMLYIVYAGNLFRVNQHTLQMEKTPLDPLPGADFRLVVTALSSPVLKLQEDTLYIIRQYDLIAVDVKTGAVLKRADLPKEMAPLVPAVPFDLGGARLQDEKPQPGAVDARAITVVGVLASRKDGERVTYLLREETGGTYQLTGEQIDRLAAQGNLDGKRARVTGVPEGRGAPAGVTGILRVQAIQVLGE